MPNVKPLPIDTLIAVTSELFGVSADTIRMEQTEAGPEIHLGWRTVVVHWAPTGTAAQVAIGIEKLQSRVITPGSRRIPLIFVSHMGSVGRELCTKAQIPWADLAGNANIALPGMLIRVEGRRPIKRPVGRPSNAFALRSSRIARLLLAEPGRYFSQRELARNTGLDEGFTSRIVHRLESDGLLIRHERGGVAPKNPMLLLDAWRESWDTEMSEQIIGCVEATSPREMLLQISTTLAAAGVEHILTGLAAARWTRDRVDFPEVVVHVAQLPSDLLGTKMKFYPDAVPQNVRFVLAGDESLFWGATIHRDIRVAHPVQIFLDLKGRAGVSEDQESMRATVNIPELS